MDAWTQLRQQTPQQVLKNLQEEIRRKPQEVGLRIFLFQLLCLLGQWERALNQLEVIKELDVASLPMVGAYRSLIQAESSRQLVFSGKVQPLILGEPPEWIASLWQSLKVLANGDVQGSLTLRQKAFDDAPARGGRINDEEFEWIADADSRFGPILEIVIDGKYYWLPFTCVRHVKMEAPSHLRDLVWQPAHIKWENEGEWFGYIPSRYPDTLTMGNDDELLAIHTRWLALGQDDEQGFRGLGQRMMATNNQDFALFDIRSIEFNTE